MKFTQLFAWIVVWAGILSMLAMAASAQPPSYTVTMGDCAEISAKRPNQVWTGGPGTVSGANTTFEERHCRISRTGSSIFLGLAPYRVPVAAELRIKLATQQATGEMTLYAVNSFDNAPETWEAQGTDPQTGAAGYWDTLWPLDGTPSGFPQGHPEEDPDTHVFSVIDAVLDKWRTNDPDDWNQQNGFVLKPDTADSYFVFEFGNGKPPELTIYHRLYGDSNLDGVFDSTDLVVVFVAGKYETGIPASFEEGDWDGDGFFNSADFVTAFSFNPSHYEGGAAALIADWDEITQ